MKRLKLVGFLIVVLMITVICSIPAWASLSSQVFYTETAVEGQNLWLYRFTVGNLSDSVQDSGYNLYLLYITIPDAVSLSNVQSPTGWSADSNLSTYLCWYSTVPGAMPVGTDIGPGFFLSGFSFLSDTRFETLPFSLAMTDPVNLDIPIMITGNATAVPVPPTVLLLLGGFGGMAYLGRRSIVDRIFRHGGF